MKILVANVGSTSYKYKLFDMHGELTLAKGKVERIGSPRSPFSYEIVGRVEASGEIVAANHNDAIEATLRFLIDPERGTLVSLEELSAVGFKTVHAGPITESAVATEEIITAMEAYSSIAPAHNPPYVAAIRAFQSIVPRVPTVAVFETAFHAQIPDYAYTYSVPYEWFERYGVRRYGFHGASLRYVSERVPILLNRRGVSVKLVICHLGGSSSVCAVKDGVSVDTSMGFALQAGIPMASRVGDIDAFILPYMMDKAGMGMKEITEALTQKGGLLGISGLSGDVRDLEMAAKDGHQRARLALQTFAYAVKKYIGAYAAAMDGLDALAFSGGIGENGVEMRARICSGLSHLGVKLDPELNGQVCGEQRISASDSAVTAMVVPTNEEIVVARETAKVIGSLEMPMVWKRHEMRSHSASSGGGQEHQD